MVVVLAFPFVSPIFGDYESPIARAADADRAVAVETRPSKYAPFACFEGMTRAKLVMLNDASTLSIFSGDSNSEGFEIFGLSCSGAVRFFEGLPN